MKGNGSLKKVSISELNLKFNFMKEKKLITYWLRVIYKNDRMNTANRIFEEKTSR